MYADIFDLDERDGDSIMKEELYQWMENLAVFYILFTALLHLVPDGKYEKYVRFFMGLLLIFFVSSTIFSLLGKGKEITESFEINFNMEDQKRQQKELENLQRLYLKQGYELEIGKKIWESLKERGIEIQGVEVKIEGEDIQAVIELEKVPDTEQKERIADGFAQVCGREKGKYQIRIKENGLEAVDGLSSAGSADGSGSHAGIS